MAQDLIDELQADWQREAPEIDTQGVAVAGRITMLAQTFQARLAVVLKPFDLQYSEFDVLATLRRSGEPYALTPTTLMETVILTSGAITAVLGRLEKAGHIRRIPDPMDGRSKKAALTPSGRRLIDKAAKARFAEAKSIIASLDPATTARLGEDLRSLSLLQQHQR